MPFPGPAGGVPDAALSPEPAWTLRGSPAARRRMDHGCCCCQGGSRRQAQQPLARGWVLPETCPPIAGSWHPALRTMWTRSAGPREGWASIQCGPLARRCSGASRRRTVTGGGSSPGTNDDGMDGSSGSVPSLAVARGKPRLGLPRHTAGSPDSVLEKTIMSPGTGTAQPQASARGLASRQRLGADALVPSTLRKPRRDRDQTVSRFGMPAAHPTAVGALCGGSGK